MKNQLIFRLPFNKNYCTLVEDQGNDRIEFVSFSQNKKIKFRGSYNQITPTEIQQYNFALPQDIVIDANETQENYLKKIESAIAFVNQHQLKKIVIARKKNIHLQNLNIGKAFLQLSEKFPNAFVYLMIHDNECWLGGFSEILGQFDKKTKNFKTMSLAGTLPLQTDWTEKEIQEQDAVSEYIINILSPFSTSILQSETYDHISGNIKHLRKDFTIKIDITDYDDLINALHPTPAVCGIPKNVCKNAISELEQFDRELYAGYIRIETDKEICSYVNLRCAKITEKNATLFAGGGITPLSKPLKEWEETNLKMELLENILRLNER